MSADQSLRDHNEIIAVTYRYALALDTRDWALLKDCFTPDAIADFDVWGKAVGVEQIIAAARPVMGGHGSHAAYDHESLDYAEGQ